MNRNRSILNICKNNGGYTLYIVFLVLSIFSILFSISLIELRHVRVSAAREKQHLQAKLLAESGLSRAEFFLSGGDGHSMNWETDKFEEMLGSIGKIQVSVQKFGLFSRIVSSGEYKKSSYSISGLVVRDIPELLKPSLTLTGHIGGLVLNEGSSIDGYITLHHGNIYRNSRDRPIADYQSRVLNRESPNLPFDSSSVINTFSSFAETFAKLSIGVQSQTYTANMQLKDTIILVQGDYVLNSGYINNSQLVVSGKLSIRRDISINHSKIFAKVMSVEGGFSESSVLYSSKQMYLNGGYHNSQFYSNDSLIISNCVKTGSMNLFAVLRGGVADSLSQGGLFIKANSKVRGTFLCILAPNEKQVVVDHPFILIEPGASIVGAVITDHDIEMRQVQIKGHVWARSLVASDENKSYTNYLLSSTITPDDELPFPLVGKISAMSRLKCIKF